MEFEDILSFVNHAMSTVYGRTLSEAELALFKGAWCGQTYEAIADQSGYATSYLTRIVGPKFWKNLSEALGTKVSKSQFRAVVEQLSREWDGKQLLDKSWIPVLSKAGSPSSETPPPISSPVIAEPIVQAMVITSQTETTSACSVDWGEAPDVTAFYGRHHELSTLSQWLMGDRCRVVSVLGMGGIGKTSLTAKLVETLTETPDCPFRQIIWRSLRNAPSLTELLQEAVPFLSCQQDTEATPKRLLHWLRQSPCLLVLDNMETILQGGSRAGQFRSGYEDYHQLLQLIAETRHQSSVILTSREKTAVVGALEGVDLRVRSLQLEGSEEAAQALIEAKGLVGSEQEKHQLAQSYNHSPLALKIVATSIRSLFDGEIALFLTEKTWIFNGLQHLLDQQFERLTPLEQAIMYWLAINREWTSVTTLAEDLYPPVPRSRILESLESLRWRSLIETQSGQYSLQPVVMEYVSDRLIRSMADELITQQLSMVNRYAMLKTTVRHYVRESQRRLILHPIVQSLQEHYPSAQAIAHHFCQLLAMLQTDPAVNSGYSGGNLLNLGCHLSIDWAVLNFSGLTIRHAYLRQYDLHQLNLAASTLIAPSFIQVFSPIFSLAFSPDSQLLAIGDGGGQAQVWQLADRQPILSFQASSIWVIAVSFSPDGQLLAIGGSSGVLQLWSIETGQQVHQLVGHVGTVWDVRFSPDGTQLASSSTDQTIRLWDVRQGTTIATLEGHTEDVRSVDFNADGTQLASGSIDQTILIWDLATQQPIQRLHHPTGAVMVVRYSPGDRYLATGHSDYSIGVWDLPTGDCVRTLESHIQSILSLCFHPDGTHLVSGSADGTAKLWQVFSGQLVRTFQGHNNWLWAAEFSADGMQMATGCNDQTVKLWEMASGQLLTSLQGYANWVMSVCFSPDSTRIATGNFDCTIRLWDVQTRQLLNTLHGHNSWVESVCFSPDGGRLISGSTDCTVKLWDVSTGQMVKTLSGHGSTVWAVAISDDGGLIASASYDNTVKLWDAESGELLHTFCDHISWVMCVKFNPSGTVIASGSADGTVKLWDVPNRCLWKTLRAKPSWVWSVCFSADGQRLAIGSNDANIELWTVAEGTVIHTLTGHTLTVSAVHMHPFEPILASGSDDQTVIVWDMNTGQQLRSLQGHRHRVASVNFSPDGRLLASGSVDGTIKLWDAVTGVSLAEMQPPRPYEGMNITGVQGITDAQKHTLRVLGAIDQSVDPTIRELTPDQTETAAHRPMPLPAVTTPDANTPPSHQPQNQPTATLNIQLLGGFCMTDCNGRALELTSQRSQALLAYLLLNRNSSHSRQHLAFVFYPHSSDSQGRSALRKDLFNLRQALPEAERYLKIDAKTIQWNADVAYTLDVAKFEETLEQVQPLSDNAIAEKQALLERAIALYRGSLLPTQDYEWLTQARERLHQRYLSTLEQLVQLLEQQQELNQAIHYAQQLLQQEPLRETNYQTLMRLHEKRGDRAIALQIYHQCMTTLRDELGVDPSAATQALYQALLN